MKKKIVSVLLVAAMVTSMGCGGGDNNNASNNNSSNSNSNNNSSNNNNSESNNNSEANNNSEDSSDVEKPEKVTILVDGTVPTKENARDEFIAELEKLIGMEVEVIQPDHDAYYDNLQQIIAGGPSSYPDIMILSSTYYSSYASQGVLWDMTEAYEASDLKKRHDAAGSTGVIDSVRIDGSIYGMPVERGNGCVTYVKKAWLDEFGLDAPTNYDEYIEMLEKFSTKGETVYGVASAGFVGSEAPYTNYLPEIYQDAHVSFYLKDDGTWADGFEEDSMKAAMERLHDVYEKGLIDPTSLTNGTGDCRNKFYSDQFGVFTYWAGRWQTNLKNNLEANGLDGELVALEPIAEVGSYLDRVPVTWCITTGCDNPEGVFKYFIEAMSDGGDVQHLWTYGVKGIHWDDVEETLFAGEDNEVSYKAGEVHFKESLENAGTQYTKAHIDPMLSLVTLANDPRDSMLPESTLGSAKIFANNSVGADLVPSTSEMEQYNGDLTTLKRELIAKVTQGELTIEQAYQQYEADGGAEWSKAIVDSLNNR